MYLHFQTMPSEKTKVDLGLLTQNRNMPPFTAQHGTLNELLGVKVEIPNPFAFDLCNCRLES